MASIKIDGLESYQKNLDSLNKSLVGILKRGVYDGADVVADAVRSAIQSLAAVPDWEGMWAYNTHRKGTLTVSQKQGLLNGLNLAKIREDGSIVNTKLSFGGYNSVKTKSFPNGQPNLMIAASIESGTSASQKQPFMRPTANRVKAQVVAAMRGTIDSDIKKIMED